MERAPQTHAFRASASLAGNSVHADRAACKLGGTASRPDRIARRQSRTAFRGLGTPLVPMRRPPLVSRRFAPCALRRPTPLLTLLCISALLASEPGTARAYGSVAPCARCNVLIGAGTTFDTTFNFFAWTGGVVVPLTLELDDSRWELGVFRMTNS
jgi:hypothetical protein